MPEKPAGIILTSFKWFEECLRRKCTVFHFSPNRNPNVKKLSPGSICLILSMPYPRAPRSEWTFVGEFTVKDVRLVKGQEFGEYASRAVEIEVPFPKLGESSWIIEFENLVKYDRSVKLSECDGIRTSSSRRPLSEWKITGFTLIKPEDASGIVEAIRKKAEGKGIRVQQSIKASLEPSAIVEPNEKEAGRKEPLDHDELIKELLELGSWLGFVTRKEDSTPDGIYRIDVTWRVAEDHAPLKAFEVETSGNVDLAINRLEHARHKWNCEQLWLIVSSESKRERALALARSKERVRVLDWKDLHELYSKLKPHESLLKDLAKR
jgi:hypothetical protein